MNVTNTTITADDVKSRFEALYNRYAPLLSSSYARIVFVDGQIDNDSIAYCLSNEKRTRWYEETKMLLDVWELNNMMEDINEFLYWLLKVPPEIRNRING